MERLGFMGAKSSYDETNDKLSIEKEPIESSTGDMAVQSSDGETKDGISIQKEATESSIDGVSSSLVKKCKVETHDPEDSDEGEVEAEGDEEDTDSNWDKDSFDGLEYHSSDDNSEYSDEEIERSCRFYNRTVIESKGFFEPFKNFPFMSWSGMGTIKNLEEKIGEGITAREFLSDMARESVQKYNKRKNKKVQFDHVLRANFKPGGRSKYYITFAAKESDSLDEPLIEYQAKVAWCAGETYPILCRPSPTPKK